MTIIELNLCDYCPFHCYYCVAKTRKCEKSNQYGEWMQNGSVLPMEQTLAWLAGTFEPEECVVLLTGGEPTIIPFGYEWSNRLIAMGYDTYILSNGVKMICDASKWNKQAKYLLTHHIEATTWQAFEKNVQSMILAGHKNIALQTVITPKMLADNWELDPLKERLGKFGFPFILTGASKHTFQGSTYDFHDARYWGFEAEPQKHEEDLRIWSVRPSGTIHICHQNQDIGDIYHKFNKGNSIVYKCYDTETLQTFCSTENTILYLKNCFKEAG